MTRPRAIAGDRRRLAALRLAAQGLGGEGAATPGDAVGRLLAMQGQDLPGVKWSVGIRMAGATERDVEASMDDGTIVRSWPMRGTLHLVRAEDLPWMLDLTAARPIASAAGRRAILGITEHDIERARELAVEALPGRRGLSAALLAVIARGGVDTGGQRGYHILWYCAQTGTLVLGASEGRGQAFSRLDAWIEHPRRLAPEEALVELVQRYFAGHGPATVHDLARWSGLTIRELRRGIAACAGRACVHRHRPDDVPPGAPDA